MSLAPVGDITILLQAVKDGDPTALDRLFTLVYDELKKIAKTRMSAAGQTTSDPTTLVNEAYLRLINREETSWQDRHHFFWTAARAMRDILVERARREGSAKRGGGRQRLELHEEMLVSAEPPDLLDLHEALAKLEVAHPKSAEIVILQFFAGLNREQIAEVLNVSPSSVWREWSFARAWLLDQLEQQNTPEEKKDEIQ
jgi:RNA polymerase sigma factor (TIGR02999 family)